MDLELREKFALYARVVSIMDAFGALTAARPSRKAFTPFTAVNEMKNNITGHFDTRILINFIKILADAAAAKVAKKKQIQRTLNIDEMLKSRR